MRAALLLILLGTGVVCAQGIIDPARLGPVMKDLEGGGYRDRPLDCEVTPMRPALNFGFRFQAGYIVRVPMSQYFGPGHLWVIVVRITPEGGTPIYLGSRYRLPDVPKTKVELEVGGGYLLGEGKYQASWTMFDDFGRVCRKQWTIQAKLGHGERHVKVAMPRETVAELSLRGAPGLPRSVDDAAPIRLTVFLHAAPVSPRRMRLGARDRVMLLGTLSSLLNRLPVRSTRLVVFNLDQQKELYREDPFAPGDLGQVAQAIDTVELGRVDYHILQKPSGHLDLLADLLNRELAEKTQSDVVVFLGPMARFSDKIPSAEMAQGEGIQPRFFYFQYRPPIPQPSTLPDTINQAVSKMKGKTLVIRTPADFAKAIEQVEKK